MSNDKKMKKRRRKKNKKKHKKKKKKKKKKRYAERKLRRIFWDFGQERIECDFINFTAIPDRKIQKTRRQQG